MNAPAEITTAEALLSFTDPTCRCELVNGTLIRMPFNGCLHGRVTTDIASALGHHVGQSALGEVFATGTGFHIECNPDTVRAPDVAFVGIEKASQIPERGFFPGAPDLAVEVLSPDDSASDVLAKVEQWLAAGTGEVWVADPVRETIAIHSADRPTRMYGIDENLHGSSILPGFTLPLAKVFG